ncbi:MAG: hypothetical protein JOZ81_15050 [Chloroflexi bacterium]|nr:hypothetical protein [Chloroflexota bacterium]
MQNASIGGALLRTVLLGAIVAVALAVASDVPVLGTIINFPGLNWLIWIGAWAWLTDRFVRQARQRLMLSENPALVAMGCGALVGAISGVLGQVVQLILQAMFVSAAASHAMQTGSLASAASAEGAWFSAFGSLIALFLYPAFGAFWGGVFGLIWGGRVKQVSIVSAQP